MGTFRQFLTEQQLTPDTLHRFSQRLEAHSADDRTLEQKRWARRRDKEQQTKPYAELGIGKPKSGRAVSLQQLASALEDKPLPPRVRGKIVRVVNAVLTKKGAPAVDAKALFGDVTVRRGKAKKGS